MNTQLACAVTQDLRAHYRAEERAERAYLTRPDATWADIEDALGDRLTDAVTESMGPDAFDWDEYKAGAWDHHVKKLMDALANDDGLEFYRLIKARMVPYLAGCAQHALEHKAAVKCFQEDLIEALGAAPSTSSAESSWRRP